MRLFPVFVAWLVAFAPNLAAPAELKIDPKCRIAYSEIGKKRTLRRAVIAGSVLAHGGIVGAALLKKDESEKTETKAPQKSHWDSLKSEKPAKQNVIQVRSRTRLMNDARNALNFWTTTGELPIDLGEFIVHTEVAYDEKRYGPEIDELWKNYSEVKAKAIQIFAAERAKIEKETGAPLTEKNYFAALMPAIRYITTKTDAFYCRELTMLINFSSEGCGNCVSHTKLMLAILHDPAFQMPKRFVPGVQSFWAHTQPVLFDRETKLYFDTLEGVWRKDFPAPIYHSAMLLGAYLEHEDEIVRKRTVDKLRVHDMDPAIRAKIAAEKRKPREEQTKEEKSFGRSGAADFNFVELGDFFSPGRGATRSAWRWNGDPSTIHDRSESSSLLRPDKGDGWQEYGSRIPRGWDFPDRQITAYLSDSMKPGWPLQVSVQTPDRRTGKQELQITTGDARVYEQLKKAGTHAEIANIGWNALMADILQYLRKPEVLKLRKIWQDPKLVESMSEEELKNILLTFSNIQVYMHFLYQLTKELGHHMQQPIWPKAVLDALEEYAAFVRKFPKGAEAQLEYLKTVPPESFTKLTELTYKDYYYGLQWLYQLPHENAFFALTQRKMTPIKDDDFPFIAAIRAAQRGEIGVADPIAKARPKEWKIIAYIGDWKLRPLTPGRGGEKKVAVGNREGQTEKREEEKIQEKSLRPVHTPPKQYASPGLMAKLILLGVGTNDFKKSQRELAKAWTKDMSEAMKGPRELKQFSWQITLLSQEWDAMLQEMERKGELPDPKVHKYVRVKVEGEPGRTLHILPEHLAYLYKAVMQDRKFGPVPKVTFEARVDLDGTHSPPRRLERMQAQIDDTAEEIEALTAEVRNFSTMAPESFTALPGGKTERVRTILAAKNQVLASKLLQQIDDYRDYLALLEQQAGTLQRQIEVRALLVWRLRAYVNRHNDTTGMQMQLAEDEGRLKDKMREHHLYSEADDKVIEDFIGAQARTEPTDRKIRKEKREAAPLPKDQ